LGPADSVVGPGPVCWLSAARYLLLICLGFRILDDSGGLSLSLSLSLGARFRTRPLFATLFPPPWAPAVVGLANTGGSREPSAEDDACCFLLLPAEDPVPVPAAVIPICSGVTVGGLRRRLIAALLLPLAPGWMGAGPSLTVAEGELWGSSSGGGWRSHGGRAGVPQPARIISCCSICGASSAPPPAPAPGVVVCAAGTLTPVRLG